ncbi:hypothetical protein Vau01_014830 [Virgisporangium aurantiacum]|uniref:Uncharacterized protein n=2 Tax=Virgisporangium aurantiacum TaxID=175570 RepID=A0A8J4DZE5_9ACTN|nr:hypothetical protein Vau01_014830 [Virgisporangium aurantiacum]
MCSVMETVGRWWNGSLGTMTRRDVFLRVEQVWEVEARQGGADGTAGIFQFTSEQEARDFVERCKVGPWDWRDLTEITRREEAG